MTCTSLGPTYGAIDVTQWSTCTSLKLPMGLLMLHNNWHVQIYNLLNAILKTKQTCQFGKFSSIVIFHKQP
jgi:hypothetical protein